MQSEENLSFQVEYCDLHVACNKLLPITFLFSLLAMVLTFEFFSSLFIFFSSFHTNYTLCVSCIVCKVVLNIESFSPLLTPLLNGIRKFLIKNFALCYQHECKQEQEEEEEVIE